MKNSKLFDNLIQAIEEGKGIADILQNKDKQEIKEVLHMQKAINDVLKTITLPNNGAALNMPDPINIKCPYSLLTHAIHNKNLTAINDILKYAQDNECLKELLASKVTMEYCMIQAIKVTYTPLTYAIIKKDDKAVQLILQYAEVNELLKEVINEQFTINSLLKEEIHNGLTLAISARNEEAYINVLERAKDAKILKEVLTSKITAKSILGDVEKLTPLAYAINYKDDRAIKCILLYAKGNDLLKEVLNDVTNDLHIAISDGDAETIAKFYHLLNKSNVAHQVFKTGIFKYIFTQKEANELAEKINKGKYEEAINVIRKRQTLMSGVAGAAMIAVAAGVIAGVVLEGVAMGLTPAFSIPFITVGILTSMEITFAIKAIKSGEKSLEALFWILLAIPGVFFITLATFSIGICNFPVIIAGGVGIATAVTGIAFLCKAIYSGFNKIEIPDHEFGAEEKPDHNELSESEVPDCGSDIEERPNDQVTQIKLENGIVREEGIGNGGTPTQSMAV